MSLIWLLLLMGMDGDTTFTTTLKLETIPYDTDMFLQGASDAAFSPEGDIYLLDPRSVAIFHWSKNGEYKGSFGKKGQGPGEFTFRGNGQRGFLDITKDYILIYDTGNRKLNFYDRNHQYVKAVFMELAGGMVFSFDAVKPETYLMSNMAWETSGTPYRQVARFTNEGKVDGIVRKVDDKTWKYKEQGGSRKVALIPYATTLVYAYDDTRKELIMADSATNSIGIYDPQGKELRSFEVPMLMKEHTKADELEWKEQPWLKNNNFFLVEYPERKAHYNEIYAMGDKGYLVLLVSTLYRNCEGVVVDTNGKTTKRVAFKLGEGGSLHSDNGQLVMVATDEDGDVNVSIVDPS